MSLTREAFERLREAIVSGALEFGEPLSETQIAKALGMSKAPVRAAFMELRDKGLVNIVPQSGTYVFSPTEEDVRMLSSFRALLEDEAVRVANKRNGPRLWVRLDEAIVLMRRAVAIKDWDAYRKVDSAFHHAFLEESENRYLLSAYQIAAPALEALRVRLQSGLTIFVSGRSMNISTLPGCFAPAKSTMRARFANSYPDHQRLARHFPSESAKRIAQRKVRRPELWSYVQPAARRRSRVHP